MVDAVIELQADTKVKYKIINGVPKADEVRYFAMPSPIAVGYIPNTSIGPDHPLEILVINSGAASPGYIVPSRVVGYLEMYKDGEEDFRVIAVSAINPRYDSIQSISDVSNFTLSEVKDYYEDYGKLHDKDMKVVRYHDKEEALELIKNRTVSWVSTENGSI